MYAVCPASINTGMYRSVYSDEPALKPEEVAMKILELCLPVAALPEALHSRFAGVRSGLRNFGVCIVEKLSNFRCEVEYVQKP